MVCLTSCYIIPSGNLSDEAWEMLEASEQRKRILDMLSYIGINLETISLEGRGSNVPEGEKDKLERTASVLMSPSTTSEVPAAIAAGTPTVAAAARVAAARSVHAAAVHEEDGVDGCIFKRDELQAFREKMGCMYFTSCLLLLVFTFNFPPPLIGSLKRVPSKVPEIWSSKVGKNCGHNLQPYKMSLWENLVTQISL